MIGGTEAPRYSVPGALLVSLGYMILPRTHFMVDQYTSAQLDLASITGNYVENFATSQ